MLRPVQSRCAFVPQQHGKTPCFKWSQIGNSLLPSARMHHFMIGPSLNFCEIAPMRPGAAQNGFEATNLPALSPSLAFCIVMSLDAPNAVFAGNSRGL